jgi:phosphatidylinositol alpha-1,6-mannosyltransferase
MTQPRTLVVTNDLPPRPGGIQTYVHQMLLRQPAGSVVVLASQWRGDLAWDAQQPYEIHRHPGQVLLPTPRVLTHAVQLAADCTSAWFGAMAPLGLLAPALRQRTRITRAVASTHGHEVGWARAPGTRQLLRRTAGGLDAVTVLGSWTGEQLAGVLRGTVVHRLPGGVDTTAYAPDPAGRAEVRRSLGIGGDQPVVVCVSRLMPRKGQDVLIEALPKIREQGGRRGPACNGWRVRG